MFHDLPRDDPVEDDRAKRGETERDVVYFFFDFLAGFVFLTGALFVTFVTAATDSFFFVSLPLKMFSQPEENFLFEPVLRMVMGLEWLVASGQWLVGITRVLSNWPLATDH
jgi:hypothetical protein